MDEVIPAVTIPALIAISLLGAVIYLMNRIEHALIYNLHEIVDDLLSPVSTRQRFMHKRLVWWNDNIHRSGNINHLALGQLMFIGALGWTGLTWQGIAAAVLVSLTYYLFGDSYGQTFINAGADDSSDQPSWWQIPVGFVVLLIAIALS